MQCNIDARGKRVRLINGIVTLLIGVVMVFAWAMRSDGWVPWVTAIALLASGGFMIFEARAGWCAIRAMGIKTPI